MKAKLLSVGVIFILFNTINFAQLLFEENFDYEIGTKLSENGWTSYSGADNNPIVIESSSLSFPGYPSSDIGNHILVDDNGEDLYANLSSTQTSGIIYTSLLVNVLNATISDNGDYFFGLSSSNPGTLAGRLYIKKSGSNFAFGISKLTGTTSFTDFNYAFDTTYLIVIKYIINSGSQNDDVVLFIFDSNIPETEPVPTILHPSELTNDPSNISVVALRQNITTNIVKIDGIRVSTSWSESPLPVELSSFTASTMNNSVKLNWKTQTEVSNYGFEIERTLADKNTWQKIGFVKGNGNSNSPKNYSYTDENLKSGKYFYRLKQLDTDGKFEYSAKVEAVVSAPLKFSLEQNFPNPFNPTTNIDYSIPTDGRVKLTIFNLLGQQAAVLIDEYKTAGEYTAVFDAKGLSSGLYFYKLESNGLTTVKKMTLLR